MNSKTSAIVVLGIVAASLGAVFARGDPPVVTLLLFVSLLSAIVFHAAARSYFYAACMSALFSVLFCFALHEETRYAIDFGVGLTFASWVVAMVVGVPFALARMAKRKSTEFPACKSCSHNLTGNETGVCPECGTEVSKEAT